MAMSEFGKAFAAARDRGDLKFKFKGKDGVTKEYTTDRKDDAPRRNVKMSSPADTAKFRAERDKPRTKVGQTGTRNFSSDSSDSAPEDGTRKSLKDLSARSSPRELGKIPPRRYSAGETKNMADLEPSKEGSLANQYRNESRMKDLEATGTIMASLVGAPEATAAFKGMTGKELLKGAAGTIPGKVVRPGVKTVKGPGKLVSDTEVSGMKKGGKVLFGNKVPAMKRSDAGESPAMVKKEMTFMQRKGAPKSMIKHEKKEAKGMKKMAAGGMAAPGYNMSKTPVRMSPGGARQDMNGGRLSNRATVKPFKKGGMIDGCAVRGKTKGKVC